MVKKIIDRAHKFYDALDRLGKWKEGLLVWFFLTIFVFSVVILTGTLTSGFHLVDDWEYAKYVETMSVQSIWECIRDEIRIDMQQRFRPLYFVNRVFTAAVFGVNLTAISVGKAIEIILAMGFLYYCARNMRCNVVYSLLFSMVVMVGYQSAVWWKLGPQESYGILLFAVGFFFLLKYLHTRKLIMGILSSIVFFLLSIYKEPFILLLPFVMLYVVYEQMKGQKVTFANLWNAVRSKLSYLLVIGLIFAVEMLLIVFVIGTNNYSYVGLDSAISLSEYHDIWCQMFHKDLKWFVRFGMLFLMILLTYWEQLKKLGWEILLTLSILVPQIITYSKSSISERYILPSSFGFAFFFVIVCYSRKVLSRKRRIVYMVCLLLMLAAHGRGMIIEANYFTYRGNSVQTMLDTVLQYTQENDDVSVLSCFGPNIEGNLTMKYWLGIHGFNDMYYWKESDALIYKEIDDYGGHMNASWKLEDMDIVVMYNREDRHWCYEPSLDLSDFTERKCGTITMYVRN